MAYSIKENPLKIEEREYGTDEAVKFSKFTSCIGVLAMIGTDRVRGIHLTIKEPDGENITQEDLAQVLVLIPQSSPQVKVIGQISVWKTSVPSVYAELVRQLKQKSADVQEFPFGDGEYGGKVNDGQIEITYS